MVVMFKCPKCGRMARIMSGGWVDAHESRPGVTCDFTRTAYSGKKPPPVELTPEQAARLERKRAAFLAQGVKHAAAKDREKQKRVRAEERRLEKKTSEGGTSPGKAAPKSKSKGKRKVKPKGSVWTVGGGLPGLGRRR